MVGCWVFRDLSSGMWDLWSVGVVSLRRKKSFAAPNACAMAPCQNNGTCLQQVKLFNVDWFESICRQTSPNINALATQTQPVAIVKQFYQLVSDQKINTTKCVTVNVNSLDTCSPRFGIEFNHSDVNVAPNSCYGIFSSATNATNAARLAMCASRRTNNATQLYRLAVFDTKEKVQLLLRKVCLFEGAKEKHT
jgi:hypothetical protein